MMRAVLLGVPGTRRTQYFMQAAKQACLPILFLDWKNWQDKIKEAAHTGIWMKIDPPHWESCVLGELDELAGDYKKQLFELIHAADTYDMRFWNHPSAIAALLDKAKCKETLYRAGLSVTELVAGNLSGGEAKESECACADSAYTKCCAVQNMEQLLELMQKRGIYQVFIKPVNGSGAAGVSAFRWQKSSGRMALYTCTENRPGLGLVNTKRLRCFSEPAQIRSLLTQLLQMDCIIERWHAKAEYQGCSYDLRAVIQGGRLDYLLARLSKGPITNLHLNNCPLDIDALKLPPAVLDEIAGLCQKAMELYPGLSGAGIDILLEKGTLKPRIIEMNGQGDLIYQDIFHENRIYRRQAELMKRMGEET